MYIQEGLAWPGSSGGAATKPGWEQFLPYGLGLLLLVVVFLLGVLIGRWSASSGEADGPD